MQFRTNLGQCGRKEYLVRSRAVSFEQPFLMVLVVMVVFWNEMRCLGALVEALDVQQGWPV